MQATFKVGGKLQLNVVTDAGSEILAADFQGYFYGISLHRLITSNISSESPSNGLSEDIKYAIEVTSN